MAGDDARAREHLEQAVELSASTGPSVELGYSLISLAIARLAMGDVDGAAGLWEDVLTLAEDTGDTSLKSDAFFFLGLVAQTRGDLSRASSLLQQSLAIRRQFQHHSRTAFPIFELGVVALLEGDHSRAGELCRESLGLWRDSGDPVGVAIALNGLAWVADERGQELRATRLSAAAAAQRSRTGAAILSTHRRLHATTVERTRAQLGEASWRRAWSEGQAMTLDQAIAYALEEEPVERMVGGEAKL
jgi:non-specific serine/threonine protein kinase